ncbi:MAG: VWA domain-containing protein [Chloroflexi bacterium]|nr:VWA domain-containing protein [Chloroflexota bacterium]
MTFQWPEMLALLLTLPLLAAGYLAVERRRAARLAALGLGTAAGSATTPGSATAGRRATATLRRYAPALIVLAGIGALVVALARPQAVVAIPREEGTVVLVIDVSASMAATDAGTVVSTGSAASPSAAPAWDSGTRIALAKAIASAFVERQPQSVVVGVVAFSDGGLSVQVPTNDQAAVLAAIDRLTPQRGTSVAQGISAALATIAESRAPHNQGFYTDRTPPPTSEPAAPAIAAAPGSDTSAVVVLISDGEDQGGPDPLEAAQAAADLGIRVMTVGVGSAGGTTIDLEGFQVHTQLDEAMLGAIAATTDGTYERGDATGTEGALTSVDETLSTALVAHEQDIEVTALMAGLGLLLVVVGGVTGFAVLGRLP